MSGKRFGFLNESLEDYNERNQNPEMVRGIKPDPHGKYIIHDEVMNINPRTSIGTIYERYEEGEGPKWSYLNMLNGQSCNNQGRFKKDVLYEAKRILDGLSIPSNNVLIEQIHHNVMLFREQFKPHTSCRAAHTITPIGVYITCLENYIFINLHQFYELLNYSKKKFLKILREVYWNNKMLYNDMLSDKFRQKYIYHILMGIKNQFEYPDEFLNVARHYLSECFEGFKNRKNTVIVILIIAKCREFLGRQLSATNIEISKFLGTSLSFIYNTFKLKTMEARKND